MTKQQMAEWLAENVLRWEFSPITEGSELTARCIKWGKQETAICKETGELAQFIYSPDGFFAVWDALIKKGIAHYFSWRIEGNNDSDRCTLDTVGPTNSHHAYGNRYEAFYNAVYEAMKEDK